MPCIKPAFYLRLAFASAGQKTHAKSLFAASPAGESPPLSRDYAMNLAMIFLN